MDNPLIPLNFFYTCVSAINFNRLIDLSFSIFNMTLIKLHPKSVTIILLDHIFNLINFKSALTAGFCLEFYNPSAFGT